MGLRGSRASAVGVPGYMSPAGNPRVGVGQHPQLVGVAVWTVPTLAKPQPGVGFLSWLWLRLSSAQSLSLCWTLGRFKLLVTHQIRPHGL